MLSLLSEYFCSPNTSMCAFIQAQSANSFATSGVDGCFGRTSRRPRHRPGKAEKHLYALLLSNNPAVPPISRLHVRFFSDKRQRGNKKNKKKRKSKLASPCPTLTRFYLFIFFAGQILPSAICFTASCHGEPPRDRNTVK